MSKKIAIIGGGAAGLASACMLHSDFDITVLERNERMGKKILVTGNGRCNLANTELSPLNFSSESNAELAKILQGFSFNSVRDFFEKLGLLLKIEGEGRVYPLSNQASAVLDVLRHNAEQNGAVSKCGFKVSKISKNNDKFEIVSDSGEKEFADIVVLATGGKAAAKTGSDGSGYILAKGLGHSLTKLSPALVPLKSDTSFTLPLKGIRAKAKITLNDTISERGEIQFTDYGISGIAAMQLSRHLTGKDYVTIDFAEEYSEEYILSLLKRTRTKNRYAGEIFLGILNRRIGEEIIKRVLKVKLTLASSALSDDSLALLAAAVKAFKLPVISTLSWDNAQVTSGGILLTEIDCETMESKLCKGLYPIGEILDSDGECGGFNLSWAWITALKAANAINKGK